MYLGAGMPAGCDAAVHDDISGLPVKGAGERGVETALLAGNLPVAAKPDQHCITGDEIARGVDHTGCGTTGGALKLPGSYIVLVKGDVRRCDTVGERGCCQTCCGRDGRTHDCAACDRADGLEHCRIPFWVAGQWPAWTWVG